MPASTSSVLRVLVLLLATSSSVIANPATGEPSSTTPTLNLALQWLATNQTSAGSHGEFFEHWAAAAAFALWLNDSNSPKARLSYSWLANQMNNPSSWFWGQYGEADVPGAVLRSFAASQNMELISSMEVASRMSQFQDASGGFRGYYDPDSQMGVTSSVDTALALWGLSNARAINLTSQQHATNYLLQLQNADGSFNLTRTVVADALYSQAPEPVSITALVVLSLNAASFSFDDPRAKDTLDFLTATIARNFTATGDEKGHIYSASLTALALSVFGRSNDASRIMSFIVSQQNSDGGFSDAARPSTSNALDTGWAAIALQLVQQEQPARSPGLEPTAIGVILVAAVAAIAIVAVLVVYPRKRGSMRPSA